MDNTEHIEFFCLDPESKPIPIYPYHKINFSKAIVSKFTSNNQQNEIHYDDPNIDHKSKILVKSEPITLKSAGIPALDGFINDRQRAYISIDLDPEQSACVKLKNYIKFVDNWADSVNTREKLFGKMHRKYEFIPSIKEKLTKEKRNLEFVRFHLNVELSGNQCTNKTKINRIINNNKKQPIEAPTITDITNEIRFNSRINLVFCCDYIWLIKNSPRSSGPIYGLGFTVYEINYKPKTPIPSLLSFLDSDSEDEIKSKDESENEFESEFQSKYGPQDVHEYLKKTMISKKLIY